MNTQKPHVAILPSPGIGHMIPLLEFAKQLVTTHGLQVTFFVATTDASAAQSQLLRSTAALDGLDIVHLPPANVSGLIPADAAIETRISIIVRESVPSLRSELIGLARPTVLLVDVFGTDAFGVADELQMPKYVFITSTAMLLALMMHLPTLDKEVTGEYVDLQEPVKIPGCKPIQICNLADPLQDRKNDRYYWLLHQASRYHMAEGIIVNTSQVLEPKTIKALREDISTPAIYDIGPMIQSDTLPLPESECLKWLDGRPQRSVLYVSFGSGGTLSAEQITELACGLELSQQRFVWIIRPPSGNATSSGTYFTSGGRCSHPSEYLPEGFLIRTKEIGLVVSSWGPQSQILRHEATGGFLTHCGWNSTLESIVHGVPMIAWPLYAEQRMNADMLTEDLKVAVRPVAAHEKGLVGRDKIEKVVRSVMESEEGKVLRARVEKVRDAVLKGLDEGGSSYNSLFKVVNEWKMSLNKMEDNVGLIPKLL